MDIREGITIQDKVEKMCANFAAWDELLHERPNIQPHARSSSITATIADHVSDSDENTSIQGDLAVNGNDNADAEEQDPSYTAPSDSDSGSSPKLVRQNSMAKQT